MEVIYGLNNIKRYKNPVVAIGVFDGVHRAHRRILQNLVRTARRIKGTGIVLTFSPHPRKEGSLSSLDHRMHLLESLGVDAGIILDFNRSFARISAARFVKEILSGKIKARYVCVGENFRFGKHAQADAGTLRSFARYYGFKVKIFRTIRFKGNPVSSTAIRKLIADGKLADAEKLLLRPVSVLGKVIKGTSIATALGFPTANIKPDHEVLPPPGVYAANALLGDKKLSAIAYVGAKPTFTPLEKVTGFSGRPAGFYADDGLIMPPSVKTVRGRNSLIGFPRGSRRDGNKKIVEVHIFAFEKNIYGKDMEVQFIKKIREEKKFASSQLLIKQIKKDIVSAKKILLSHS
ncbi:MAG: bifunctional riboflavin kinase/FMN adenylyltransferase [Candidatus Omnitrophica bacterium]|nr:bifunctional riboflavin kinase/FMN adenylyltransferase [Candidatus Omnitrophota bacterium]